MVGRAPQRGDPKTAYPPQGLLLSLAWSRRTLAQPALGYLMLYRKQF
jgi:hypothetical protein